MFSNCGAGEDSQRIPWIARRSNQPVEKEINPEYSLGRTNVEAEAPIIWPTWCEEPTHWKRPWCWKDWRQEEKGTAKNEMVRWHRRLDGHEFEQTVGDSEGQGSLRAAVHGVTKSWTWLSNWTTTTTTCTHTNTPHSLYLFSSRWS